MTSSSIFSLKLSDYQNIDERFKPFLNGWYAEEVYNRKIVKFPGTGKSKIFPYRYFEVIKEPGDENYNPDEPESDNEKCLCLWAGWKEENDSGAYDDEVDIRLWIRKKAVLDTTKKKVSAEIFKTAGSPITLKFKNKLVTNFKGGFLNPNLDKVWIEDMNRYLVQVQT